MRKKVEIENESYKMVEDAFLPSMFLQLFFNGFDFSVFFGLLFFSKHNIV